MTFHELNILPAKTLRQELFKCCGSTAWVNKMMPFFPMDDLVEMLEDAEEQWYACEEADWREAFTHHPKIGDMEMLEKNFAATAEWASGEQAGVKTASRELIEELAAANAAYEKKFGYIFIICASGKTTEEMLRLLQHRLSNAAEAEIKNAIEEQNQITLIRLQKLIT
ncbi:MAG: 2-oxo-4-hydroxy-4-carboxy-5-ureidoimidazoline decarboxylase [Ferruginibacter sp.]